MVETCMGGPRPINLHVKNAQTFFRFAHHGPGGQNGSIFFEQPDFPNLEDPRVGDLPFRLETCKGGPRRFNFCVKNAKTFWTSSPTVALEVKWAKLWNGRLHFIKA